MDAVGLAPWIGAKPAKGRAGSLSVATVLGTAPCLWFLARTDYLEFRNG